MQGDPCIERWSGRQACGADPLEDGLLQPNLSLTVSASPTLAQIVFCCICHVLGHQP